MLFLLDDIHGRAVPTLLVDEHLDFLTILIVKIQQILNIVFRS